MYMSCSHAHPNLQCNDNVRVVFTVDQVTDQTHAVAYFYKAVFARYLSAALQACMQC